MAICYVIQSKIIQFWQNFFENDTDKNVTSQNMLMNVLCSISNIIQYPQRKSIPNGIGFYEIILTQQTLKIPSSSISIIFKLCYCFDMFILSDLFIHISLLQN